MKLAIRSTWLPPLVALALLFAPSQDAPQAGPVAAPSTDESASEDLPPDEHDAEPIPAAEVWAHPAKYLGQTISIDVQMHSEAPSWNPMLTRFGPDDFRAFRAWSDEQFPWIEADFRRPLVRVYARKRGAAEWALESAPQYARYELLCHISANFAGQPWIEVLAVKPHPRRLDDGAVIHATRGIELMAGHGWEAAIGEFERANSSGIPFQARAELERLIAFCIESGENAGLERFLRRQVSGQE